MLKVVLYRKSMANIIEYIQSKLAVAVIVLFHSKYTGRQKHNYQVMDHILVGRQQQLMFQGHALVLRRAPWNGRGVLGT